MGYGAGSGIRKGILSILAVSLAMAMGIGPTLAATDYNARDRFVSPNGGSVRGFFSVDQCYLQQTAVAPGDQVEVRITLTNLDLAGDTTVNLTVFGDWAPNQPLQWVRDSSTIGGEGRDEGELPPTPTSAPAGGSGGSYPSPRRGEGKG